MPRFPWFVLLLATRLAAATPTIVESIEIGRVPSGFPVGFCLLTHEERQYVAYYDEQHRMTVASRSTDSSTWQRQVLPSTIGWDSHNYITMAVDSDGQLHVTGNMHADPLVYFRTTKAGDIATLEPHAMTGRDEDRVTYPKFLTDAGNRLIFTYRDGGSGRGVNLVNRYDPATRKWSRLLDTPLLDGEGETSAYPHGPIRGDDGWFHMMWVWRDTPDCSTNHHLSYARSPDLIHWESASGDKVVLPITIGEKRLWVDPIANGGIINGGSKLLLDGRHPVIAYHKNDEHGHMQIYAARHDGGRWRQRQLTDWNKPVSFGGNGTMGFIGIDIGEFSPSGPDAFMLTYHHRDFGRGRIFIDRKSLEPVKARSVENEAFPAALNRREGTFPGLQVKRATDQGSTKDPGVQYVLKWETLEPNQDKPRPSPLPEPSILRLYKLKSE